MVISIFKALHKYYFRFKTYTTSKRELKQNRGDVASWMERSTGRETRKSGFGSWLEPGLPGKTFSKMEITTLDS